MSGSALLPPTVAVNLDGARLILRGPLTGRLAQAPHLADFLARCQRLQQLQHVRFDLLEARIELSFASGSDARAAARGRLLAHAAARRQPWGKAFLAHLGNRVWEAPVTLYRSGALLSTWRLEHLGAGRVRLVHPLLRTRATAAWVAARLEPLGVDALAGSWQRHGAIDLQCHAAGPDTVLDLLAEAEAMEAALSLPGTHARPVGKALLLNANLLLAAGALALPVLAVPSTLLLAAASVPVFKQAWERLREQRADMTTVLASLAILALITGDRLPAALMLWLFRQWDVLSRRALRRVGVVLFERLLLSAPPSPMTLRAAAEATTRIFASVPRAQAAKAFADESAPLILCVGAAAVVSGGPALAQAAMRPDFFSSVLVHRRMAGASVALRLAGLGCVVRSLRTLLILRDVDQVVLDDSVDWQDDADLGGAVSALGLREIVYFHHRANAPPHALVAALGRPRLIERSMVHTPAAYLAHQRFLGHRIAYARAVDSHDRGAAADVAIAVGGDCLVEDRDAPVGLMRPSLALLLSVMRQVHATDAEERQVKTATNVLNTALVAGAIYAGLPTLGVVATGAVATGALYTGLRHRIGQTSHETSRAALPHA